MWDVVQRAEESSKDIVCAERTRPLRIRATNLIAKRALAYDYVQRRRDRGGTCLVRKVLRVSSHTFFAFVVCRSVIVVSLCLYCQCRCCAATVPGCHCVAHY
jgi:hypothetical protein